MENTNEQILELDPEYIKIVEEAAEKELDLEIANSTLGHAVFLSQKLISKSKNNIKILTGELSSPYYNTIRKDLEDAAKRFVSVGGEIKIIIWEKDVPTNQDFEDFISTHKGTVTIKKANQTGSRINHFLVSDSKRYRLEQPHTREELLREEVRGAANFNNPDNAKVLDDCFERVWSTIPSSQNG